MSYAGAATNIVGGEMQKWAALTERQAMFDEYKKEQARQAGYAQQAQGQFAGGLANAGASAAQTQLGQGAQDRSAAYQKIGQVPLAVSQPSGQSNSPQRDLANAALMGRNRAAMGSYSDWGQKQMLNNLNTSRAEDQTTNFAGGIASVFPYREYQAQHSQDFLAMMGQAISSIGGGAANYAQYAQAPQGGQQSANGYGAGGYYPYGQQYSGYSNMNGYQDAYGTYYPTGWNNMGGSAEGTVIPG